MTGPKISFWMCSSSWSRPASTVGAMKYPSPRSVTREPPATTDAWAGTRLRKPVTRSNCAGLLTGPKSASSSSGMPTLAEFAAYSPRAATKSS